MTGYLSRRLLAALVTVWIVATAGFLLVEGPRSILDGTVKD